MRIYATVSCLLLAAIVGASACSGGDNEDDCFALQTLYNSTQGLPWQVGQHNVSVCSFSGVECDASGRVVRLDLHNRMLRGFVPDEISHLTELKELYLNANELSGKIPASVGSLQHLTDLNIEMNLFEGSLVPSIANLTNLEFLSCGFNKLTGTLSSIDFSRLTKVRTFKCDYNQLQGELPASLNNMSSLVYLILSYNQFTGAIPPLNSLENLYDLELHNNFIYYFFNHRFISYEISMFIYFH